MPKLPELISLHVSPWSERAKWTLDHHGIAYRVVQHVPILGERKLRRVVGPSKPRATVPVLVTEREVLSDSWDIVLWADRIGSGAKLVPEDRRAEIERWITIVDEAMNAGRGLTLAALLESPQALDEAAAIAPRWLRPLLRPITRRSTQAFARKYAVKGDERDAQMAGVRAGLDALRKGLSGPYLLGTFSFADIVAATMLQGVSPPSDRFLRLGPATRATWTKEPLATDYADLVKWRDALYEAKRQKPQ